MASHVGDVDVLPMSPEVTFPGVTAQTAARLIIDLVGAALPSKSAGSF